MIKSHANIIIIVGFILLVIGLLLRYTNLLNNIGRLPGDILIKKENTTFYMPLTTMILLSIIVSLIMRFFKK